MQTSQQQNTSKYFQRSSLKQRLTGFLVFISVSGFFTFFGIAGYKNSDLGNTLGRCGFREETGLPCPTCGFTTATVNFAQGKILKAFYIQPAATLLCMMLFVIGVFAFITAILGIYFKFIKRFFEEVKIRHIILALLIIVAAGWAVTMARAISQQN